MAEQIATDIVRPNEPTENHASISGSPEHDLAGRTTSLSLAQKLWANKAVILAVTFIVIIILGPFLAPMSPLQTSADILTSPSRHHLFGTDSLGRDVFSRILSGGRILVLTSMAAGAGAVMVGAIMGLVSGYKGGAVDSLLMRSVDILISMPPMLVILVFSAKLPRNTLVIVVLVAMLLSPGAARIIRGLTLQIASRDFIAAAEAAGVRTRSILLREILPNVRGRLAVEWALRTAFAMLLISSLSFLGVGVNPPTPDWGLMVNENRGALTIGPWATLAPALAIFLAIVTANVMADWLDRRWA